MSAVRALASVVRLNTRLFLNCLVDVDDAKAMQRPSGSTNSLAFIACHLVDSRHFVANYLSLETSNPFAELLAGVQGIEDVSALPSLERIREAWRTVSAVLEACVSDLGQEELAVPSIQRFPVDDPTLFGGLGFLVQHESYHIGQMALIRKYLGYPAMTYK